MFDLFKLVNKNTTAMPLATLFQNIQLFFRNTIANRGRVEGRVVLFYSATLQESFWNIETNYRKPGLYCAGIFLT